MNGEGVVAYGGVDSASLRRSIEKDFASASWRSRVTPSLCTSRLSNGVSAITPTTSSRYQKKQQK